MCREQLAEMVDMDVIPQLMAALARATPAAQPIEPRVTAAMPDIAEFAEFVMTEEAAAITARVAALLDRGMTIEAVFLGLLTATARHLGTLWEYDLVYFTDVAIGLMRLHDVMRSIGAMGPSRSPNRTRRRRALLLSMRGEMHHFGLFMVANVFQRADWDVLTRPLLTDEELAALICKERFDIVGLSVSSSDHLDGARTAIGLIRDSSRNRPLKIIVGGRYFVGHPDAAAEIGADGSSRHAFHAVDVANRLVGDAGGDGWRELA
jgi:methanogenic corrinoid protein MtbC1